MLVVLRGTYRGPRRKRIRAAETPVEPLRVVGVSGVIESGSTLQVTVTLNTTEADPLVFDEPPTPVKWTARYNNKRFAGVLVSSPAYDQLVVGLQYQADETGQNVLAYLNDPSDIADSLGRELAACEVEIG